MSLLTCASSSGWQQCCVTQLPPVEPRLQQLPDLLTGHPSSAADGCQGSWGAVCCGACLLCSPTPHHPQRPHTISGAACPNGDMGVSRPAPHQRAYTAFHTLPLAACISACLTPSASPPPFQHQQHVLPTPLRLTNWTCHTTLDPRHPRPSRLHPPTASSVVLGSVGGHLAQCSAGHGPGVLHQFVEHGGRVLEQGVGGVKLLHLQATEGGWTGGRRGRGRMSSGRGTRASYSASGGHTQGVTCQPNICGSAGGHTRCRQVCFA